MIDATISHYRIVQKLGLGGTGNVYKAVDTRLHRFVALKFLPDEIAHDAKALASFQRAALILSDLNHPNICPIYDIDAQNGQTFLATEFLEGLILKLFIATKPVPIQTIFTLAIEIADTLQATHSRGIIHGNIKPSTIFVTRHNQVKLLDFALAKPVNKAASPSNEVLGSEAYMSPEQVNGQQLDARTDLFSFGAALYEMCTGVPPFHGDTRALIFQRILESSPTPPMQVNPELAPGFEVVLNKALEKDRERRYQSAAEMKAALADLRCNIDTGSRTAFPDQTMAGLPGFFPSAKNS